MLDKKITSLLYQFKAENVVEIGIYSDKSRSFYGDMNFEFPRIFDVASLTKAVTAETAKKLIGLGYFSLTDQLKTFLPEFKVAAEHSVTIEDLLRYHLNLDLQMAVLKDKTAAEIWQAVMNASLKEPVGSSYNYANSTSLLLGACIEAVTQKGELNLVIKDLIFKPLGMVDTTFFPLEMFSKEQLVPSEIDLQWRKAEIRGEVHDESAWKLRPKVIGSAGLFSSSNDMLTFGEYALRNGSALGWELDQSWMGELRTTQTFGKTGFTGCSILIDPSREVVIVIMSNFTYPQRPQDRSKLQQFRAAISDVIFESLD